jgi:hypothetical protein
VHPLNKVIKKMQVNVQCHLATCTKALSKPPTNADILPGKVYLGVEKNEYLRVLSVA